MTTTETTFTSNQFRAAMSVVPTSVVIASTMVDEKPIGMVIGTFTSVSMDPPLVGFFGDRGSSTLTPLLSDGRITYSLLRQEDLDVVNAFRAPMHERFDQIAWTLSDFGTPMIDGSPLVLHTRTHEVLDAGDHVCVLSEIEHIVAPPANTKRPLVFYRRRLSRLDPGQMLDEEMWQLGWHDEA